MAGRQREDQARRQVPARVGRDKSRRRAATEDLSVNDSARRRLAAEVNTSSAAEVRRLVFINLSTPLVAVGLRVKRAASENEARALIFSRLRRSVVARLREPSAGRDNRKAERRRHQKKRHRLGTNNFAALTAPAPERETPEPFRFQSRVVGRLYQTPTGDLFIFGKTCLVWPLFAVRDQTGSNWILSNVVPLLVD